MFVQLLLVQLSFTADKAKLPKLASWVHMNPNLDLWKAGTIPRFAKALDVSTQKVKEMLTELDKKKITPDTRTINKLSENETEDRAIGVMLWAMMGDILGAPLEGLVATGKIGKAPWVQAIKDILPHGPVSFYPTDIYRVNHKDITHRLIKRERGVMDYVEVEQPRIVLGWYTDDTAAAIGLARTLVEQAPLTVASFVPETADGRTKFGSAVGQAYVEMAEISEYRGIPNPTVIQNVAKDYTTSGKLPFETGSFANGGAMRIGPLGVVTRTLGREDLRKVVTESIRPTHINPIAIDGATIIARLVGMYMNGEEPDVFEEALQIAQTPETKKTLKIMQNIVRHPESEHMRLLAEKTIQVSPTHSQSFLDFQMRADIAVAVVLYAVAIWGNNPEQCLINVAALGGDSDTNASMAGAIMGARYGTAMMPARWFENAENGTRYHNGEKMIENIWGRDNIISLAKSLNKVQIEK
jgi:ADP-ribosylglycohydrolase